jgi:hypothetical protein
MSSFSLSFNPRYSLAVIEMILMLLLKVSLIHAYHLFLHLPHHLIQKKKNWIILHSWSTNPLEFLILG